MIVVPTENYLKNFNFKSFFPNLNLIIILSKKKIKYFKELWDLKKAKNMYVMQLDDDVELDKECLYVLYKFIKGRQDVAVAPRYSDKINLQVFIKNLKIF